MVKLTGSTQDDRAMAKKERIEQLKVKEKSLEQLIIEAIARGKDWKPPKKGKYVLPSGIGQPMFIDEPRDIKKRMPKSLMVYKGDIEFERKVSYESEKGSYRIRRKPDYYMISTLAKDLHVRGQVIADPKTGEPKYLYLNPMGDAGKQLVWTIKLTGSLFTKQQKRQFKAEIRSKKIAELQAEVEQLKVRLKIETELKEALEQKLVNIAHNTLRSKLRKLVSKDKEATKKRKPFQPWLNQQPKS